MLCRQLACFAGMCAIALSGCSDETDPQVTPRTIRAMMVKSEILGETFSQTGTIQPRYEIPMSFRLDGLLTFRVENGSSVQKGDLVATLEKTPSTINVSSASAQVEAAKSEVALADITAARNWELFPKNVISRAQVQQGDANLHAAKAKLEIASAALESAQQALSYTDLRAGRDGVISGVSVNAGQVVTTGQTILTLSSNKELDAVFDVPERMLSEKLRDAEVEVSLISNPALVTKGKVREVTPSANAETRTYRVKVTLGGAVDGAPLGAAVTGKVVLSPKRVFEVPSSALTAQGQDKAVFVYEPATKTLHARAVTVERYTDSTMVISKGLDDGDIIATAGVSKLRDAQAVTIEKDERP
jgi:RND family efflux transporter MFP subunit